MKPHFVVYTVIETKGSKDFWQRVGSAWSNKDGSLNIVLNALPVNGKLHVRVPSAKDQNANAVDESSPQDIVDSSDPQF